MGTTLAIISNAVPWNNQIRALCDTGAQSNLITKKAVIRLGLKTKRAALSLTGPQETTMESATESVQLSIKTINNQIISFTFYVVPKVICDLPVISPKNGPHNEFNAIKLADPGYLTPSPIDALFGLRVWIQILEAHIIRSKDRTAVAQSTKLGYVIFQEPRSTQTRVIKTSRINVTRTGPATNDDHVLSKIMQQFWLVENMPYEERLTPDEQRCEDIFMTTHDREEDGRYSVSMPFNDKLPLLGRSKSIALKQLFAMERKMSTRPQFASDYRTYMREFENQGFMSKINETHESGYYTPHHGVYGSSKEKIRIVYNASSKTSTGITLNECQLTGARLQDDLAIILMRFRTHRIGITADIKAMYCQVSVHKNHRKYQKILWRHSTTEPVSVYQLDRVAFGQTAAPFLAIRAMQQCAADHAQEFPEGAQEVKQSFYVDDLLTGGSSPAKTINLIRQITGVLNYGHFPLAKYCSNSIEVNRAINGAAAEIEIKDPEMKSVLGLIWIAQKDQLAFKLSPTPSREMWTKRYILSEIGRLYDPNGYIAPIIIVAKIIIQELWKNKSDWDEPVIEPILGKWNNFRKQIHDVKKITIPRWLGTADDSKTQLHGFSDASQSAYACCVYARTTHFTGRITIQLIQSKTRVAPIQTVNIPRLELCGAHLLTKLITSIIRSIKIPIEQSFCWVDSEVVLQWLFKYPGTLKTFVGNRVAYIQEKSQDHNLPWHWVPGPENPADLASRGVTPSQLVNNSLWWHGPKWLSQSEDNWPEDRQPHKTIDTELTKQEIKSIAMTVIAIPTIKKPAADHKSMFNLFEAYDSYLTMWHVVAYVLRAVANFKTKNNLNYIKTSLSIDELEVARLTIVRNHQMTHCKEQMERYAIDEVKVPEKCDQTVWYDRKTQVLRLFGRVITDNLTFDERFPIIISSSGPLAAILMKYAHNMTGHGGAQQMLQFIRRQYWIPKARQLAQKVIHRCRNCRRYHLSTVETLMATLPAERTTPIRAFKECGVDYMGPINIASRKGRNPQVTKGYVSVFVCFVTRAIHLEVVSDGTREAFIQALRRIMGRRGHIKTMWSDNGTTFVGANNYLNTIAKQHQLWAPEVEHDFHMAWRFIVPRAPSWGGIWEAAVKSVKKHIVRVIGTQNLTYEEWSTLLPQVEAWVNSRPMAPLSDDPRDIAALTPAHFLIGESLIPLPEPAPLLTIRENRLARWELVQKFNQDIWRRWHTEYLITLIARTKWKTQNRNFQLNDIVIIKEDNMPPGKWHLGRIIQPLPSRDGIVRAAKIRTLTGDYIRPILKLALLMESSDDPDDGTPSPLRPITEQINKNLSSYYDKLVSKHPTKRT